MRGRLCFSSTTFRNLLRELVCKSPGADSRKVMRMIECCSSVLACITRSSMPSGKLIDSVLDQIRCWIRAYPQGQAQANLAWQKSVAPDPNSFSAGNEKIPIRSRSLNHSSKARLRVCAATNGNRWRFIDWLVSGSITSLSPYCICCEGFCRSTFGRVCLS